MTFAPTVSRHHKRKDGTINVKIRITHKGVSRWLPTAYYALPSQLRAGRIKDEVLLARVYADIHQLQGRCSDLSLLHLDGMTVDDIVAHIKEADEATRFRLDFFEFGEVFCARMKEGTRKSYESALNSFARFLGERRLDVNAMTGRMLTEYAEWVQAEPKISRGRKTEIAKRGTASAKLYIERLSAIFTGAKRRYNDDVVTHIPRNPFSFVKVAAPVRQGQRNLGVEVMQRIISATGGEWPDAVSFALDLFVVSFALMGANVADLVRMTDGETVIYQRSKTKDRRSDGAEMRVDVPDCIGACLRRLGRGRGMLMNVGRNSGVVTKKANRGLKAWAQSEGLPVFTMYAARHSFATIARSNAGIDKALVDEMLNHAGNLPLADIYIERDFRLINEANRKVLALFNWE